MKQSVMGGHGGGVLPVVGGDLGSGEVHPEERRAWEREGRGQQEKHGQRSQPQAAMQTLPEVINPSAGAAAGFRHWEAIWDLNEGPFPGVLATETRLQ